MSKKEKNAGLVELIHGIDELGEFYTLLHPEVLTEKLKAYPDLMQPLIETHNQIKKYFGENCIEAQLRFEADSEYENEGIFVIEIMTNLSPDDAFDILNKFDDEWFISNIFSKVNPILTVTVGSV